MALKGTNQEYGRPYNRRLVLETIRLLAPVARGEIAKRVGLTVQTVSTIIRELELQGFVRGVRETPKGRGLPPTFLNINPDGGYAIGVHVTPVELKAALINLSGDVIDERERALPQASRTAPSARSRSWWPVCASCGRVAACSVSAWRCRVRSTSSP